MKMMNKLTAVLLLLLSFGVSSCLKTNNDYKPQGAGVVEVINSGQTYFKHAYGRVVYPTVSSLKTLESKFDFKPAQTKTAYVLYDYEVEKDSVVENANMQFGVKLDATVEMVDKKGASNDSVATLAIRSLDPVESNQNGNAFTVMNNRFLVMGLNYIVNRNTHHFTMVYYDEETAADGTLKLYLRHTGKKEEDNIFTTSFDWYRNGYPHLYLFTFDMERIFKAWRNKNKDAESVRIVVEADVNLINSSLEKPCEKKEFVTVYKFKD